MRREATVHKDDSEWQSKVAQVASLIYDDGYVVNSIQFIPQEQGYIFTTILTPNERLEAWLFTANDISQGPITKLCLPDEVHFGFSLHSEYLEKINTPRNSDYKVDRMLSAVRSIIKVPYEFIFNQRDDILNRKVTD